MVLWIPAKKTRASQTRIRAFRAKPFCVNISNGRWGQGPGNVDPRFLASLPFPAPEILECVAFCYSEKFVHRDFPGVFLGNPRTDPGTGQFGNSHNILEFSEFAKVFFQTGAAHFPRIGHLSSSGLCGRNT